MKLMKKLNKIIVILVKKRILVADRKFYHTVGQVIITRQEWTGSDQDICEGNMSNSFNNEINKVYFLLLLLTYLHLLCHVVFFQGPNPC